MSRSNADSRDHYNTTVIPAKAGIQTLVRRIFSEGGGPEKCVVEDWIPAFAGMTSLYLIFVAVPCQAASLRPLHTEEAQILPTGTIEVESAVAAHRNRRSVFPNFDIPGTVYGLPAAKVNFGVGSRLEFQVEYEALLSEETGEPLRYGAGDLLLWSKIRAWDETPRRPAIGLRIGGKPTTASQEHKFGTNESDFFADFLASKHAGPFGFHGNGSLEIFGDPNANSKQLDVYAGRGAVTWQLVPTVQVATEVSYTAGPIEGRDPMSVRGGLRWDPFSRLALYTSASYGLTSRAEDWSVEGGVVWRVNNRWTD